MTSITYQRGPSGRLNRISSYGPQTENLGRRTAGRRNFGDDNVRAQEAKKQEDLLKLEQEIGTKLHNIVTTRAIETENLIQHGIAWIKTRVGKHYNSSELKAHTDSIEDLFDTFMPRITSEDFTDYGIKVKYIEDEVEIEEVLEPLAIRRSIILEDEVFDIIKDKPVINIINQQIEAIQDRYRKLGYLNTDLFSMIRYNRGKISYKSNVTLITTEDDETYQYLSRFTTMIEQLTNILDDDDIRVLSGKTDLMDFTAQQKIFWKNRKILKNIPKVIIYRGALDYLFHNNLTYSDGIKIYEFNIKRRYFNNINYGSIKTNGFEIFRIAELIHGWDDYFAFDFEVETDSRPRFKPTKRNKPKKSVKRFNVEKEEAYYKYDFTNYFK